MATSRKKTKSTTRRKPATKQQAAARDHEPDVIQPHAPRRSNAPAEAAGPVTTHVLYSALLDERDRSAAVEVERPVSAPLATVRDPTGLSEEPVSAVLLTHRQTWSFERVERPLLLHQARLAPGASVHLSGGTGSRVTPFDVGIPGHEAILIHEEARRVRVCAGDQGVAQANARCHRDAYLAACEVAALDPGGEGTEVFTNQHPTEVLRVIQRERREAYRVETRVTDAQRLLFLPLQPIDFASEQGARMVATHAAALARAAHAIGQPVLAASLADGADEDGLQAAVELASARATNALQALEGGRKDLANAEGACASARKLCNQAKWRLGRAQTELERGRAALASRGAPADGLFLDPGEWEPEELERLPAFVLELGRTILSARSEYARASVELANADETRQTKRETLQRLEQAAASAQIEQRHKSAAARLAGSGVGSALNRHELTFSQAVWLDLDPIAARAIFGDATFEGERLRDCLIPTPVATSGNLVGFPLQAPTREAAREFAREFTATAPHVETVALGRGVVIESAYLPETAGATPSEPGG